MRSSRIESFMLPLVFLVVMTAIPSGCLDERNLPPGDVLSDEVIGEVSLADVRCVPACDGVECGPDGCGGSCGECTGGSVCVDGDCVCSAEHHKDCAAGDVYWFDSCGVQGDKYEECGDHACSGGVCQSASCPDGFCNGAETQCSCEQDCGLCAGCCSGQVCELGAAPAQCGKDGGACQDCTADDESCVNQQCECDCGDGMCCDTETCSTCPGDCGECPGQCGDALCDMGLEECVQAISGGLVCVPKSVSIPAGTFWMGCNNCAGSTVNDTDCGSNEHSYHLVSLDAYEMDRTEVTAEQYGACVSAGICTTPGTGSNSTWQQAGEGDHPINYVSWSQAWAYCEWTGKELCTEAQWEKGARGGCEHNGGSSNCKAESRKYPWGNDSPTCSLAVMSGCPGDTQPVCSVSPAGDSPYGLCDLAGNVWEWTADWYQKDFYCDGDAASGDGYCTKCSWWPGSPDAWLNPYCDIAGLFRVGRGGSLFYTGNLRVSNRSDVDPSGNNYGIGGRCCRLE